MNVRIRRILRTLLCTITFCTCISVLIYFMICDHANTIANGAAALTVSLVALISGGMIDFRWNRVEDTGEWCKLNKPSDS